MKRELTSTGSRAVVDRGIIHHKVALLLTVIRIHSINVSRVWSNC